MSVLSSLLARDQAVPVKKIEEAIQRQVISGGELPTVLLEVGAAPENQIASYHAAAVDLLPASRDEVMLASPDVTRVLKKPLADKHRVVPIALEVNTLVVAASYVPGDAVLGELAEATGRRVTVRIATEPRIAAALDKHYGVAPSARMRRLVQKLEGVSAGELVQVTSLLENRIDRPSVPTRDSAPDASAGPSMRPNAVGSWARTSKAPPTGAEEGSLASGNARDVSRAPSASESKPPSNARPGVVAVGVQRIVGTASGRPDTSPIASYSHGRASSPGSEPAPAPPPVSATANRPAPAGTAATTVVAPPPEVVPETLDADAAVAALANADNRDAVLAAAFAHVRTYFDYCAIFTAHDEEAEGFDAAGDGATRDVVRAMTIELERPGTVRDVRLLVGAKAGVLDSTEADRELAARLGRTAKQPSVIIPVAIRQRLVLLVYGDRGGKPLGVGDVSELIAFLPRVSDALQRLILQRKRGSEKKVRSIDASGKPVQATAKDWARKAEAARAEAATPSEAAAVDDAVRDSGPVIEVAAEAVRVSEPASEEDVSASAERPRAFDLLGVPRKAPQPPDLTAPARGSEPAKPSALLATPGSRPSWVPGKPVSDTSYRGGGGEEEVLLTRKKTARRSHRPSRPPAGGVESLPPASSLRPAPVPVVDPVAEAVTPLPADRPNASLPPASAAPKPAAAPASLKPARTGFDDDDDDDEPEISVSDTAPASESDATIITELGLDLDEIVDTLISADRDGFDARVNDLLQFGEPALRVLLRRFPGPLWIDRRPDAAGPHPRGRDAGPVIRAMIAFRPVVVANVATLLDSRDPDTRYFAVLVAAEMPHRDLVGRIGRRVLDDDAGVRAVAVTALRACRRFDEEVGEVLAHFRRVAGNDRAPVPLRKIAVELLGELRDGDATTMLVDVLGEGDAELAKIAQRALVRITKQDLGAAASAWSAWLAQHGSSHRIEWLIDALLHEDEVIRREAGEELKNLTQEYFGFQSALPRKEREVVQRKYRKWWETHGRTRFVHR